MNTATVLSIAGVLLVIVVSALMRRWVRPDIVLTPRHWGRVYVFQDVRSPTLIKVGVTKRQVSVRQAEVSDDMTGGRHLRCLHVVHMPYAAVVEAEAHRLLGSHREWSERGREWFRLKRSRTAIHAVGQATRTVRRVAKLRHSWSKEAEYDFRKGVRNGGRRRWG